MIFEFSTKNTFGICYLIIVKKKFIFVDQFYLRSDFINILNLHLTRFPTTFKHTSVIFTSLSVISNELIVIFLKFLFYEPLVAVGCCVCVEYLKAIVIDTLNTWLHFKVRHKSLCELPP